MAAMRGRPLAHHGSLSNPLSNNNFTCSSNEREILHWMTQHGHEELEVRAKYKKGPYCFVFLFFFVNFGWQIAIRGWGCARTQCQMSKDARTASLGTLRHLTTDHARVLHVNFVRTRK